MAIWPELAYTACVSEFWPVHLKSTEVALNGAIDRKFAPSPSPSLLLTSGHGTDFWPFHLTWPELAYTACVSEFWPNELKNELKTISLRMCRFKSLPDNLAAHVSL
jgi:hypothetical protein